MIFTESHFNRIKDKKSYKVNFNYQTVEKFNNYVKDTLEVENINILINNIIRIMNIINETDEDNNELEIKELILKANLSENSEKFKEILSFLENTSDEKILRIHRIIDKRLLDNLDNKIDLLIKIEKMCEYFYSDFSDRLTMNRFEVSTQKKNSDKNQKLNIDKLCEQLTQEEAEKLIHCLNDKFGLSFLQKVEKWINNIKDKK